MLSSNTYESLGKSPIQRHMMCSKLPLEYTKFQNKPIPKTKQFYRSEQFIWNNPHRTSPRLYRYYHKARDSYKAYKEPLIKQMQEKQKEYKQLTRIVRLAKNRQQTRHKLLISKMHRIQLQERTGIIKKRKTRNTQPNDSVHENSFKEQNSYLNSKTLEIDDFSKPNKSSSFRAPRYVSSQQRKQKVKTSKNQRSFMEGVQKYDQNKSSIFNRVDTNKKEIRTQIRQDFEMKKARNLQKQNSIMTFMKTRKLSLNSLERLKLT